MQNNTFVKLKQEPVELLDMKCFNNVNLIEFKFLLHFKHYNL